jgi:SAM-dependent methyltransferase
VTQVAPENAEALEAWNGVLFDRFVHFRDLIITGIAPHGDEAIRSYPPQPGDRVLDIGCGFGDATQELALLVGQEGSALGVDVAPRFVEAARGCSSPIRSPLFATFGERWPRAGSCASSSGGENSTTRG